MKVKYVGKKRMDYLVSNNSMALTFGKVYEVLHVGDDGSWYGIVDDSEDGEYGYPANMFEIVEE